MNRIRKVMLFATLALALGVGSWYLAPVAQAQEAEATETPQVSKLDSSSTWKAEIAGGCTGGGFCCLKRLEGHLEAVENIKKFEADKASGFVTLTIKKGQEVNVKELQEALGSHWTIKTIEKSEEKGAPEHG